MPEENQSDKILLKDDPAVVAITACLAKYPHLGEVGDFFRQAVEKAKPQAIRMPSATKDLQDSAQHLQKCSAAVSKAKKFVDKTEAASKLAEEKVSSLRGKLLEDEEKLTKAMADFNQAHEAYKETEAKATAAVGGATRSSTSPKLDADGERPSRRRHGHLGRGRASEG